MFEPRSESNEETPCAPVDGSAQALRLVPPSSVVDLPQGPVLRLLNGQTHRVERESEDDRPEIAGRIPPTPPIAERLWSLRTDIEKFITTSLRPPGKFGFASEPMAEVDALPLQRILEESAVRMMLMSQAEEGSPTDEFSIYREAAEGGAQLLNQFLPEIRVAARSGVVAESHQEGLFLSLADLKSNLTQLYLNVKAAELQQRAESEADTQTVAATGTSAAQPALKSSFEQQTLSRAQLLRGELPIEKVMHILTQEVTRFISEHHSRGHSRIGFVSGKGSDVVRTITLQTLLEESREFAESLANDSGKGTGIDLTLRTMAHNLATVCDSLIIPFTRRNWSSGVNERDMPELIQMLEHTRAQLMGYRKQLKDYRQILKDQGVL